MRNKKNLIMLSVFLVSFASISDANIGSTTQIDRVRGKNVLDNSDFQVIDSFVAGAVNSIVTTQDFSEVSKLRNEIISRSSSQQESASFQYSSQFSQSAVKYIGAGFETVSEYSGQRKVWAVSNLLILVNELEQPELAEMALEHVSSSIPVIQYWSVRCVSNPEVITKLQNRGDNRLIGNITKSLEDVVANAGEKTLFLIQDYASFSGISETENLMLKLADRRISDYQNWSVNYAFLDSGLLLTLAENVSSAGVTNPAVAGRFGQLLANVMQMYIKGQNVLGRDQRHQLASVLITVERDGISEIFDLPQSVIKTAIENQDMQGMQGEYNRLFGDGTNPGVLSETLDFEYGDAETGQMTRSPEMLPDFSG